MSDAQRSLLSTAALVLLTILCVVFAGWQIYHFVRGPQPARPDGGNYSHSGRLGLDRGMQGFRTQEPSENNQTEPQQER